MEVSERNPSPSPEDSLANVAVGKTLFSRSFLYSTLLEWIAGLKGKYGRSAETQTSHVLELDSALEDSLCQLWDMTMEPDVVDMLVDHDVISIIMQTLEVSSAPRLIEIALGILANMLSVSARLRNETIAENVQLSERVLESLYTTDPPSIYEALRVLNCLYYDMSTSLERLGTQGFLHVRCLTSTLLETKDVPNLLAFILSSCTNDDVLTQCLSFLAKIIGLELEGSAPFLESFSCPDNLISVVEGMNQLGVTKTDPIVGAPTWRVGVDGINVISAVITYKRRTSESREPLPHASRICDALGNFLHQSVTQVDVDDDDVVRMNGCLEDIACIAESGLVACPELKLIVVRSCALADTISGVLSSMPESEKARRVEMSGVMTNVRTLITKALKSLPGAAQAVAAEEMTKLMRYMVMPSLSDGEPSQKQ